MLGDNGFTNSGTDIYINEGRDAFYAGHAGIVSPYEVVSTKQRGWKHDDWVVGYKDAEKNCTPEQREARYAARLAILDKQVSNANIAINFAKAQYQVVMRELSDHLKSNA